MCDHSAGMVILSLKEVFLSNDLWDCEILRRFVAACSLLCGDSLSLNIQARVSHQTWHLPYSFQARPHTGAATHLQSAAQDSSQNLSGNTSPSAVVWPPSCVWLSQSHKVNTSLKQHYRWNWLELLCMAEMFILLIGFFLYYYQLPICHVQQLQHDRNFPDILFQMQDKIVFVCLFIGR